LVEWVAAWEKSPMLWHFGPFRLDRANAGLWRAEQPVTLRPKTFEVLVYLVTHAGQLVTKEALLDAIWPETVVGEGVLKTSMNELRKALGETAKAPQWIATVHRRGYRFVAPVMRVEISPFEEVPATPRASLPAPAPMPALPPPPVSAPTSAPLLVAREAELATLHQWFAKALQGERHLGFITGEAGIGKTTLVDTFVTQLAGQASLWLGHGQCIEQYGAGEAYLPLLEALGQMGRTPDGPPTGDAAAPAGAELVAPVAGAPGPDRVRGAATVREWHHAGAHAAGARRGRGSADSDTALCLGVRGSALE
jgi:DNA-binding winged helix-turn-helix (wHTH) protein